MFSLSGHLVSLSLQTFLKTHVFPLNLGTSHCSDAGPDSLCGSGHRFFNPWPVGFRLPLSRAMLPAKISLRVSWVPLRSCLTSPPHPWCRHAGPGAGAPTGLRVVSCFYLTPLLPGHFLVSSLCPPQRASRLWPRLASLLILPGPSSTALQRWERSVSIPARTVATNHMW